MQMKTILSGIFCVCTAFAFAQRPFAHEQALHKDSSAFTAWATHCTVLRGYQDIADPSAGYATIGDESSPLGVALSNGVLSLGDGGSAILTFAQPIRNGQGPDFAVFENGFLIAGDSLFFLEFGFVEVSSDGQHFVRFPAASMIDTTQQAGNATGIDPRRVQNLAGNYATNYGTPFDLEELKHEPMLNVNRITHIKVIDVVGSLDSRYAQRDASGRKINDPWPTPFASSGFDLAGIGVINQASTGIANSNSRNVQMRMYPVPAQQGSMLTISSAAEIQELEISDLEGRPLLVQPFTGEQVTLSLASFAKGIYMVKLSGPQHTAIQKLVIE